MLCDGLATIIGRCGSHRPQRRRRRGALRVGDLLGQQPAPAAGRDGRGVQLRGKIGRTHRLLGQGEIRIDGGAVSVLIIPFPITGADGLATRAIHQPAGFHVEIMGFLGPHLGRLAQLVQPRLPLLVDLSILPAVPDLPPVDETVHRRRQSRSDRHASLL